MMSSGASIFYRMEVIWLYKIITNRAIVPLVSKWYALVIQAIDAASALRASMASGIEKWEDKWNAIVALPLVQIQF